VANMRILRVKQAPVGVNPKDKIRILVRQLIDRFAAASNVFLQEVKLPGGLLTAHRTDGDHGLLASRPRSSPASRFPSSTERRKQASISVCSIPSSRPAARVFNCSFKLSLSVASM